MDAEFPGRSVTLPSEPEGRPGRRRGVAPASVADMGVVTVGALFALMAVSHRPGLSFTLPSVPT